jgi:hypothetical protein
MVIYRGADGRPGYHQTEELNDAIRFVEGLRNEDGVEHARIFRMDEVNFEFRPYFRVEIGSEAPELAPAPAPIRPPKMAETVPPPPAEPAPTPAVTPEPVAEAEPVAAMAEATSDSWAAPADAPGNGVNVGRRGLFGR